LRQVRPHFDHVLQYGLALLQLLDFEQRARQVHLRAKKIRRQFYGVTQHARGKTMFTQLPGDESQ